MNQTEIDTSSLVQIASIVIGFGLSILVFRVGRELQMRDDKETVWIPWADYLLLGATGAATVGLITLLVVPPNLYAAAQAFLGIMCVAALSVLLFYPLALLAHYRIGIGAGQTGPRDNPEPAERIIVWLATVVAIVLALVTWLRNSEVLSCLLTPP